MTHIKVNCCKLFIYQEWIALLESKFLFLIKRWKFSNDRFFQSNECCLPHHEHKTSHMKYKTLSDCWLHLYASLCEIIFFTLGNIFHSGTARLLLRIMIIFDIKNKFWTCKTPRNNHYSFPWSSFDTGASNHTNEITSIKFIEKNMGDAGYWTQYLCSRG